MSYYKKSHTYPGNNRNRIFLKRGFTLLELIVALGILAVVISGLLASFVYSVLLNESNANLVIAANDAQYVMEQIKGLAYNDIDDYEPPDFYNLQNENIAAPGITDISSGLKEVTVNVSWSERQRARSFSLSTRIAR